MKKKNHKVFQFKHKVILLQKSVQRNLNYSKETVTLRPILKVQDLKL
jgi:hypothetical protein